MLPAVDNGASCIVRSFQVSFIFKEYRTWTHTVDAHITTRCLQGRRPFSSCWSYQSRGEAKIPIRFSKKQKDKKSLQKNGRPGRRHRLGRRGGGGGRRRGGGGRDERRPGAIGRVLPLEGGGPHRGFDRLVSRRPS
jgi:hypothetical protein